ncbi:MAG: hypothetical protein PUF82_08070 [Lactobacillus equicursoris]|uniref:hypothetical protein n=1 Tax=Lactobacillus equicursoris TaxID=420645 RepID=UPI00242F2EE7|nr:hypothetical protein [Lactobacillus equicursoris]MDD6407929.1 hypothetical protein [Lactobacillus equicursoris]
MIGFETSMIGKLLFLLVFIINGIFDTVAKDDSGKSFIFFCVLCLTSWKVFGVSCTYLITFVIVLCFAYGFLRNREEYSSPIFSGIMYIVGLYLTGWGAYENIIKQLKMELLSVYGGIGSLKIVIIATPFTLMLVMVIHWIIKFIHRIIGFMHKEKVRKQDEKVNKDLEKIDAILMQQRNTKLEEDERNKQGHERY